MEWIEDGGNVGLSLYFDKPGAFPNPLRFVVFDDDDGTARAWLVQQGITSPWMVMGRRGSHLYALLPDDVPDLVTRQDPFKPCPPKMDVKTSGLVVLPMDNGKFLHVDGQPVTVDTMRLLDRFNTLEGLRTWLPRVDPRTVIPGMKERPLPIFEDPSPEEPIDTDPGKPKRTKKKAPVVYLSVVQPETGAFHPNYKDIPYHAREKLARSHAGNVLPSIPGKDPWGKLVKVVNDCIHHYGMSDRTTWEIVRDHFNPRCRHAKGGHYPWRKGDVAEVIRWAHQEGSYSTMRELKKLADPEKLLVRLKKKGLAANARRRERLDSERQRTMLRLSWVLAGLGYVEMSAETEALPLPHLGNGSIEFQQLHQEVLSKLEELGEPSVTPKMLGAWLAAHGLTTAKGLVRRSKTRPSPRRTAA